MSATPCTLTTQQILDRFQSLCNEIGCVLMVQHSENEISLAVDRGVNPAPIEAKILAVGPGRIVFAKTEDWRK